MRKSFGTAILALTLATSGSALLGGTALASADGLHGGWQSAKNNCGTIFTPNYSKCIKSGGQNATNNCVNGSGGSCKATTNNNGSNGNGGTATNNCININGTCKAKANG